VLLFRTDAEVLVNGYIWLVSVIYITEDRITRQLKILQKKVCTPLPCPCTVLFVLHVLVIHPKYCVVFNLIDHLWFMAPINL
jgi:hypothetical protein